MAGAGMRDIKRRIKSVNSTKQITKAMELVASAKVRKARSRMEQYRPYFSAVSQVVGEILGKGEVKSAYVEGAREIKKTLYIVIAGDRGLCGGYNSNVYKQFVAVSENSDTEKLIVPIGVKSVEYFKKRNYDIKQAYPGIAETITYDTAKELADEVLRMYEAGEIDEVYLIYTQFVSMLSQQTKKARLLPISATELTENLEKLSEESESVVGSTEENVLFEVTLFEPNQEEFFNLFVPQYVESMIYGGIVEGFASEQAARRAAMENATDNATEMIEQLTLFYNRARQAAITQEITEIVAGADALE